jgi:hypothetical protein
MPNVIAHISASTKRRRSDELDFVNVPDRLRTVKRAVPRYQLDRLAP